MVIKKGDDGEVTYVARYVDDLLVLNNMEMILNYGILKCHKRGT